MSDKVKVIKIVTISTIIFIFLLAVSLIINLIKINKPESSKRRKTQCWLR